MRMKNLAFASIITLMLFGVAIAQVHAVIATVAVEPVNKTVPNVNVTFDMNVTIQDVQNLYGYEFMLWYNTTLLNATAVFMPAGHFLTPVNPSNIFIAKNQIDENFNATHGRVWFGVTLVSATEPTHNGSGVLTTVTFKSIVVNGPSPIYLLYPAYTYPVKLASKTGPIPNLTAPAFVTVVPEFPATLIIPLLIVTTTVAVALAKPLRLRKRVVPATK